MEESLVQNQINPKNYLNKIIGISDLKRIFLQKKNIEYKTRENKISIACFEHYRFKAQSEVSRTISERERLSELLPGPLAR